MLCLTLAYVALFCFAGVRGRVVDEAFPQHYIPNDTTTVPLSLAWLFGTNEEETYVAKDERSVCRSQECKYMGKLISEGIDKSVNPCDDFYQFVCGKWPEHHKIPEGYESWSLFHLVAARVNKELREIISEEIKPNDVVPMKTAKRLYQSCIDTDAIEEEGLKPWVLAMSRIGGWPMIMEMGEWDENTTWQKVDDYYADLTSLNTFYTMTADLDGETVIAIMKVADPPLGSNLLVPQEEEKDDTTQIIHDIDVDDDTQEESKKKHKTTKRKRTHKKHKKVLRKHRAIDDAMDEGSKIAKKAKVTVTKSSRQRYVDFVTKVAMAVAQARRLPMSAEKIANDVEDLVNFHSEILQLSSLEDEEPMTKTLKEFQEYYDSLKSTTRKSKINWFTKLFLLFRQTKKDIDIDLEIKLPSKEYFEKLVELLDKTSERTIVNHVHWMFLSRTNMYVNDDIRRLFVEIGGDRFDATPEARAQLCLNKVQELGILGYEFVKRYVNKDAIKAADKFFTTIQKEVEREIQQVDWMDENTKEFALEKVKNIQKAIGYPEWYNDPLKVQYRLAGYAIGPSYFDNMVTFKKIDTLSSIQTVGGPLPKDESLLNPVEVNAFFFALFNMLIVTAADLRSPIYVPDRPSAVNYGFLGFLLGHEVGHGYDGKGHVYDKNGKLTEWLAAMANAYSKRTECFVEQYDNYASQIPVNKTIQNYGSQTLDENIADTMGLQAVYRAFKTWREENDKPDPALPGLEEYNNDQAFFISFASLWCEASTSEFTEEARNDEHSTAHLRVIGSVSNSEDFAKVFNCPVGSPMNPKKKCSIWN